MIQVGLLKLPTTGRRVDVAIIRASINHNTLQLSCSAAAEPRATPS